MHLPRCRRYRFPQPLVSLPEEFGARQLPLVNFILQVLTLRQR